MTTVEGCDAFRVEKVLVKYSQQDISNDNAAKILPKMLSKFTHAHAIQDATNLSVATAIP